MKLNWLWFDLIDPDLPLDRHERHMVKRHAKKLSKGFRTGLNGPDLLMVVLGVAFACIPVAIMVSGVYMPRTFRELLYFATFWFVVNYTFGVLLNRWSRQRWINQALRDFGYDVCLSCGYWLRGLDDRAEHCPECGAARQPLPAIRADDA